MFKEALFGDEGHDVINDINISRHFTDQYSAVINLVHLLTLFKAEGQP